MYRRIVAVFAVAVLSLALTSSFALAATDTPGASPIAALQEAIEGFVNRAEAVIASIETAVGSIATSVSPSAGSVSYTASAAAANVPVPPAPSQTIQSAAASVVPTPIEHAVLPQAQPVVEAVPPTADAMTTAQLESIFAGIGKMISLIPRTASSANSAASANVESRIAALQQAFSAQGYSAVASPPLGDGAPNTIAAANNIGQLSGTAITNPSITGGSISNASVSATGLSSSGDASVGGNLAVTGSLSGASIGANSLSVSSNSALTGNVSLGSISSTVVNDGKYNAFPGLTLLPNDHLIVVYRKGTGHVSTDGVIYYRTSSDQGQTWSPEATVYSSPTVDARDPEIVLLNSGKLLLSFFTANATSSVTNVYTMFGTPTGDSVSWGSANLLNTGFTQTQAVSSKAIQLANGNIVLPVYGDNTGETNDSAAVVTSTDGGNTWSTENTIASNAGGQEYDEANGVQLPSGRIVLLIRHDVGTTGYARVYSDDNGATWSSPVNVISQPSSNEGRPTVLLLNGGGLFLLTRTTTGSTPTGYAVSWDQGVTWTDFAGYGYGPAQYYMYGSAVLQPNGAISAVIARQTSATDSYITYQEFLPPSSGGLLNTDTLSVSSTGSFLGALGIGTTSPLTMLSVQGTAAGNDLLNLANSTGASLLYVQANGNVGIGTTNPGSMLEVEGVVTGQSFSATSASATSSFADGINLTGGCFAIAGNCLGLGNLSGTVGIANGGTNQSSQTTNGINYFDGTHITSGSSLTYDGSSVFSAPLLHLTQTTGTSTIAAGQGFTIAGSQFVVQQGSGNVGIGTASPQQLLQINGSSVGAVDAGLRLQSNTNHGQAWDLISGGGTGINGGQSSGDFGIVDVKTGVVPLTIGGYWSGPDYVGINNIAPAYTLDVKGQAGASSPFNVASSTGTSELMVSNFGNVGIGKTSPTYLLDVNGTGHSTALVDASNFIATSTSIASTFGYRVGIGTASPNYPLDVNGVGHFSSLVVTAPVATQVILTTGTSWTVPSNWNSGNNTVEVIGGGGGANTYQGGGGGAYAKISNLSLTPLQSVTYQVGAGGVGANGPGGDTYFNSTGTATTTCGTTGGVAESVCAKGGTGQYGGLASNSIGTVTYSGGNGPGGGGGAAGPHGAGSAGQAGSPYNGGAGDNGYGGAGGVGAAGGNGTEWGTAGSGGGGENSYPGGNYGGGAGRNLTTSAPGVIVITYIPLTAIGIGIGTAIPVNSFDVAGAAVIGSAYAGVTTAPPNGLLVQGNIGIGTSTPYSRLEVWGPDSGASTTAFLVANSASSTEFYVSDNGNAVLAGGLTQTSDQRLKTNIRSLDASSSLSLIDQLNPVTFNWIDPNEGPTPQLGFIAQQVQQVFPNLVSTTSPTALTPDGTLSLNYIDLISPIVSAIQELDQELASLASTVAGFAESITSQRGTFTDELCVGSTCVTPAQFQAMVATASQSSSASTPPSPSTSAATDTPPIISINGDNPATIQVGATYTDLGATITGPQADLNLGIATFVNGAPMSPVQIDTTQAATDTIDYVVTDQSGLTATSTRTVIIQAANDNQASSTPANDNAAASTTNATSTTQ